METNTTTNTQSQLNINRQQTLKEQEIITFNHTDIEQAKNVRVNIASLHFQLSPLEEEDILLKYMGKQTSPLKMCHQCSKNIATRDLALFGTTFPYCNDCLDEHDRGVEELKKIFGWK